MSLNTPNRLLLCLPLPDGGEFTTPTYVYSPESINASWSGDLGPAAGPHDLSLRFDYTAEDCFVDAQPSGADKYREVCETPVALTSRTVARGGGVRAIDPELLIATEQAAGEIARFNIEFLWDSARSPKAFNVYMDIGKIISKTPKFHQDFNRYERVRSGKGSADDEAFIMSLIAEHMPEFAGDRRALELIMKLTCFAEGLSAHEEHDLFLRVANNRGLSAVWPYVVNPGLALDRIFLTSGPLQNHFLEFGSEAKLTPGERLLAGAPHLAKKIEALPPAKPVTLPNAPEFTRLMYTVSVLDRLARAVFINDDLLEDRDLREWRDFKQNDMPLDQTQPHDARHVRFTPDLMIALHARLLFPDDQDQDAREAYYGVFAEKRADYCEKLLTHLKTLQVSERTQTYIPGFLIKCRNVENKNLDENQDMHTRLAFFLIKDLSEYCLFHEEFVHARSQGKSVLGLPHVDQLILRDLDDYEGVTSLADQNLLSYVVGFVLNMLVAAPGIDWQELEKRLEKTRAGKNLFSEKELAWIRFNMVMVQMIFAAPQTVTSSLAKETQNTLTKIRNSPGEYPQMQPHEKIALMAVLLFADDNNAREKFFRYYTGDASISYESMLAACKIALDASPVISALPHYYIGELPRSLMDSAVDDSVFFE